MQCKLCRRVNKKEDEKLIFNLLCTQVGGRILFYLFFSVVEEEREVVSKYIDEWEMSHVHVYLHF